MALPRQIRKQVKEANELLATLNSKPGEAPPAPGDPPAPAEPQAPAEPPVDANNKKPDEPAQPAAGGGSNPPPVAPVEDFEQKYRVLQGKYDAEVGSKDRLIGSLNERISVLEQLVQTLRANPPAPASAAPPTADDKRPGTKYVKPEDLEEYGNDMVGFVQRAAREAVAGDLEKLQTENAELKRQLGHTSQQVAGTARERLLMNLSREVPNWETVNVDAKFLAWLNENDIFSGLQRKDALVNAYNANDAGRVVAIFKAFIREDSATDQLPATPPRTAAVDMGTLVAPGTPKSGPGAEAPGDNKKIWTQGDISAFYDQKRRGKISADVAIATEREIALAARENRVRL